jgi:DNA end-binding protein Ku
MQAIWKGVISFGLVTIPVRLYAATESKTIPSHQVHSADGGRVGDGELVILTDEELADLSAASSRSIEVISFLPIEAIDPIYFDRSYYVEPERTVTRPYLILRDALQRSGRVSIVRFTLRLRETLGVLRASGGVLILATMLWPDEVRDPRFSFLSDSDRLVAEDELAMAEAFVDALAAESFDPSQYRDPHREALAGLIAAKGAGREVAAGSERRAGAEPADLMAALRASGATECAQAVRWRAGYPQGDVEAAWNSRTGHPRLTTRSDTPRRNTGNRRCPVLPRLHGDVLGLWERPRSLPRHARDSQRRHDRVHRRAVPGAGPGAPHADHPLRSDRGWVHLQSTTRRAAGSGLLICGRGFPSRLRHPGNRRADSGACLDVPGRGGTGARECEAWRRSVGAPG